MLINFQFNGMVSDSLEIILSLNVNDSVKTKNVYNYFLKNRNNYELLIQKSAYLLNYTNTKENETLKMYAFFHLGWGYDGMQFYELAVENYYNALEMSEKINDNLIQCQVYNLLGIIASIQGQDKKSIYLFKKAYLISEKIKSNAGKAMVNNIGIAYYRLKQYPLALVYFKKALNLKGSADKTEIYCNLLELYIDMNENEEAKTTFDSLENNLKKFHINEDLYIQQVACISKGKYFNFIKNYDEGIKSMKQAEIAAKKMPIYDMQAKIYFELSKTYQIINNTNEAFYYYKKYIASKDSLLNKDRLRKISESENKFNNIKIEKELQVSKLTNANNELKLKRNKIIIVLGTIFSIILLIGLLLFYRLYKDNKRKNLLLTEKNTIIEEKQKEILASIRYAQRIQESLLPSLKFLKNKIK